MGTAPGNIYGVLQMLSRKLMVSTVITTFVHADLEVECSSTYQVLLGMTISAKQAL